MQSVASTLHTTSEHGVSSITTADAHTSAASSRLNWRPPADLNGLVRFAERRNLVSAGVSSHFNWPLPIGCPETSLTNYRYSLRNDSEDRGSHLPRRGSQKPLTTHLVGKAVPYHCARRLRAETGNAWNWFDMNLFACSSDRSVSLLSIWRFRKFSTYLNLLTPNVNYSGRTAPLTYKVTFYIFIQQI